MSAENRICENCLHAGPAWTAQLNVIECRESPPAMLSTPNGVTSMFPLVDKTAHCGRWLRRDVEITAKTPAENRDKSTGGPNGNA